MEKDKKTTAKKIKEAREKWDNQQKEWEEKDIADKAAHKQINKNRVIVEKTISALTVSETKAGNDAILKKAEERKAKKEINANGSNIDE